MFLTYDNIYRGDMTYSDSYLAVIPPQLESVVFSIDGSFTTNFSILANDPKVRPSAVDVVRFVLYLVHKKIM